MTRPDDYHGVISGVRLGWAVAEVRGRNRPGGPAGQPVILPPRHGHPLPLRMERSPEELRLQAQATLLLVAHRLHVDQPGADWNLALEIERLAHALAETRERDGQDSPEAGLAWDRLSESIYRFDAHVQDVLSARSDTQACGYQLGRGLAECYWALDPDSPKGWASWAFLFDPPRCGELARLVGRMSGYLQPYSAPAVAGSLEVWKLVATNDEWRRQPTVRDDLYQQIRNWYELLILDQDPTRIVRPYHLITNWRVTIKAAVTFLPQLLLAGAGLLAVLFFAFELSQKHPAHWVEALTTVLGVVGLTGATVTAKLKNEGQVLFTRFKQDAYTDLIAESITTVPDPPRRGRALVVQAVRNRTVTPSSPGA
ncbi:MAG: hypothetical protein JO337_01875 [Acidimicrobiales bacterium]|nr:hypothetical protein [Acidimicrobiales bacterium]